MRIIAELTYCGSDSILHTQPDSFKIVLFSSQIGSQME